MSTLPTTSPVKLGSANVRPRNRSVRNFTTRKSECQKQKPAHSLESTSQSTRPCVEERLQPELASTFAATNAAKRSGPTRKALMAPPTLNIFKAIRAASLVSPHRGSSHHTHARASRHPHHSRPQEDSRGKKFAHTSPTKVASASPKFWAGGCGPKVVQPNASIERTHPGPLLKRNRLQARLQGNSPQL